MIVGFDGCKKPTYSGGFGAKLLHMAARSRTSAEWTMPKNGNGFIENLEAEALAMHAGGRPGKFTITPTKPLTTQRDLSLAYSPGVAAPCLKIAEDPAKAFDYTIKGNLVAVITNGTAVLGLGDLGAQAAKPVMEGKCGPVQAVRRYRRRGS